MKWTQLKYLGAMMLVGQGSSDAAPAAGRAGLEHWT